MAASSVRRMGGWRRLFFAASVLVLISWPLPLAFSQLPEFLRPKDLPLEAPPPPSVPAGTSRSSPPEARGPAPRITFIQAARLLHPGETWEVFIVLEDVEEDLKSLEWELRQEGPGGTSQGAIPLELPRSKPKEGQEVFQEDRIGKLAGFLALDTDGPDVLRHPGRFDGLRMTLSLTAVDANGLRSERRNLLLTFRLGAPRTLPPVQPGVSFRHRIGAIHAVFPDPLRRREIPPAERAR